MPFEAPKNEASFGYQSDDQLQMSKRSESRQRVLLRAQLHAIDRQGDVRITDLSRSGLRGVTNLDLCVDQSIFVTLDDITHRSGTIRWIQDRRIGVKFGQVLDVLPDTGEMDVGHLPCHQARIPRTATQLSGKITLCNSSASAKIRNVSKSGLMIETDMRLKTNTQLLVSLSDGKILAANVKWVEGDRVGIQLSTPVSILQFTCGNLK